MPKKSRRHNRKISLDFLEDHLRNRQHNDLNVNSDQNKVINVWQRKQQEEEAKTEQCVQQRKPYSKAPRCSYDADRNYEEWPTISQSMTCTMRKDLHKNKPKQKSNYQQQQSQHQHQQEQQQQQRQQHQQQEHQQQQQSQHNQQQEYQQQSQHHQQQHYQQQSQHQLHLQQEHRQQQSQRQPQLEYQQKQQHHLCNYQQQLPQRQQQQQQSNVNELKSVSQHSSWKYDGDRSFSSTDKFSHMPQKYEERTDLLSFTSTTERQKTEHDSANGNGVRDGDSTGQIRSFRPIPRPRHTRFTMELNTASLSCYEKNPISAFMEYGQARGVTASVEQVSKDGPDNEPTFTVAAFLNKKEICRVCSKRLKDGRAAAADKALRILNSPSNQKLFSRSRKLESSQEDELLPLPSGTDPVSALMEYAQANRIALSFSKIKQAGPPHQPTFIMVAILDDKAFEEVQGGQLKQVKKKAAIRAIKAIDKETGYFSRQFKTKEKSVACSSLDESFDDVCPNGKNPVSVLMEYAQGIKKSVDFSEVKVEGPDHSKKFTYAVVFDDELFPKQTGSTKKNAQRKAAAAALRSLKERRLYHVGGTSSKTSPNHIVSCKTFEDKIAALCQQKFDELVADVPDDLRGRKVVAAVISKNEISNEIKVISIGSGNRCITGDKLSMKGNVITDSHAEIIAKRGFRRYLYNNIWSLLQGNDDTVMEYSPRGKFQIKREVSYHLYISTAPCGDGALFTHSTSNIAESEFDSDGQHIPIKDSDKQGQLRIKLEKGEGTIPIDIEVQSWDGIKRGDRLRTMSCSDKICSWNVLGLQGALLSNVMEPVYLGSITLGQLFSHGHLCRAVCCRVDEEYGDLPDYYSVNHPRLGQVSAFTPTRNTEKSRAYSINWNITDSGVEVTDGTTGLLVQSLQDPNCRSLFIPGTGNEETTIYGLDSRKFSSRLSKENLYKCYKSICHEAMLPNHIGKTYRQTKRKAIEYQLTKGLLKTRFLLNGCGNWLSKPEEIDSFQ